MADFSQFFPERYDSEEWVVPECSVIWGNNPIVSNGDGFLGHWIVEAMKRGTELVVVDPRLTWMAAKAKYWLPIRPATDAALGMAFINVIAEEDLVDHEFIDLWCYGYEELVDACREWTPERAAEVCWVKADDIRAAARFMATAKPMNIQWGLAIDQQISSTPAGHCILALSAITGNVDVPGGNVVLTGHAYDLPMFPGSYINYIPESERDKRLGMNIYPFRSQSSEGMGLPSVLLEACESNGERSDAIEKYPIKMIFFCGNDPIACMGAEAPRIYETLNKIDFICVSDYQHTPLTMASADLVLPCSMGPERNSLRAWWWPLRSIAKVTEFADTRSDEQIMVDVINRLNPDAAKGIETDVDWLNWMLDGSGYDGDFEKLKKEGVSWPKWEYRKHEKGLVRSDGGLGFRTPSGRFNLKVDYFESLGLPTVPYYDEPKESPYSSPELYQEYPLILMTGRRSWEFFHSEHRNMPTMREFHPDPLVEVSPELAEDLELLENDWVWIENHRGRCRQRVKITPGLNPKFVMAEHAWWIPEADPENLYDVFEHNINNLTTQAEIGRSGYGAPYSGLLCKIYKCTEENSKISPSEQVLKKGGWKYERKHIEFD